MEQPISCSKARTVAYVLGIGAALAWGSAAAQDKILPPPYQITGANLVVIGVVWDEAAVRKVLPPGITPVKEMTGGINIYQTGKVYVIGTYQSAYYWVDIEGFDSPEGIKGRWMLAGVYGPEEITPAALKQYYGLPVRVGTSRVEATAEGKRATATVNGQDFISAEIKSGAGECSPAAGRINYPGVSAGQVVVNEIPFVGDSCKAEPVSLKINAPADDPFSAYTVSKILWAAEVRNASFTFTAPSLRGIDLARVKHKEFWPARQDSLQCPKVCAGRTPAHALLKSPGVHRWTAAEATERLRQPTRKPINRPRQRCQSVAGSGTTVPISSPEIARRVKKVFRSS